MSDGIYGCACSAYFYSAEALNGHVEEARSIERLLYSQYLKSRIHANANNDDRDGSEYYDNDEENVASASESGRKHRCPHPKCDSSAFATRAKLRRHFQQRTVSLSLMHRLPLSLRLQMSNARKFVYAASRC
ncbi:Uncharacterized protein TPAR_08842 [Tolypocladium paradoxum]|uniref:Uncharacterized protein n=1 Tax=Tolypocladium paradoxum TaxID=94208 RepID=A0A2S4KLA1_9HYPO|nr:Uncharacterized protein TPAR_08842 [Tolypocladium paradoxum]